jgi:hypothetical protein
MAEDDPTPMHFAYPFRWDTTGHAAVNDQDSVEDVADCVVCSALTPKGWRVDTPEFGITDPTFSAPVDVGQLLTEIDYDEPRAKPTLEPLVHEEITRDEFVANVRMAI